jgi:lysophosphatidylcholine acyltransferase/lyso-PAF acetyltransferase
MESELEDLNPKSNHTPHPDASANSDGRPLLKPDSTTTTVTSTQPDIDELEKKFAAYVRNDVYGTMGLGELPLSEKLMLGFALVTLLPVRVLLSMTLLLLYYLICRICTMFSAPNREDDEQEDYANIRGWKRTIIVQSGRYLSRSVLFVLGFYWIPETHQRRDTDNNNTETESDRPGAVVSNHISYLDILYHMSASFPSFVAKRSVSKLPLIGLISKCLGCVYVQRESKSSDFKGVSGVVNERVREAYQDKFAPMMMLFPEGTTTNGDFLLPFKTGAFLSKAPVLPVILRYPYRRFSPAWDTISGVRHVIYLFCQFVNCIEVTRLPIYYPSQQEKDDPKLYAENVRKLMAHEGNLTLSDIGLAEKRVYHAALNGLLCQR